jgi:hypothetical protein
MITSLSRRVDYSGLISVYIGLAWLMGVVAGPTALAQEQTEPMIEGYAVNLDDRKGTTDPLIKEPLPLSIEVNYMLQKRKLNFDEFGVQPVQRQHSGAYLGLDITRSLTLRGLVGSSELKSSVARSDQTNGNLVWGAEVEGRLVNWHIDPAMVNISWIQFDASARYLNTLPRSGDNEMEWREGYGV